MHTTNNAHYLDWKMQKENSNVTGRLMKQESAREASLAEYCICM